MSFAVKNALVEAGYLSKSSFQNLVLYSYTDLCTFDKKWTPETLMSRGTIYDMNTGKIVARAFDKFFNLGEHPTTMLAALPVTPYMVDEKEDGSLGILYQFPGKADWRVATRGSFYSDQAKAAEIILESCDMSRWPTGWTPLVEIIYPENRIVTDYGQERKLVLLAAREISEEGRYMSRADLDTFAAACGFARPKRSNKTIDELAELAKTLPATHEGWVLSWPNGFRVKIKGARHMELARFLAHLSLKSLWEVMMQGDEAVKEFLLRCPPEFRGAADDSIAQISNELRRLEIAALGQANILDIRPVSGRAERKEMAGRIMTAPKWTQGYLFAMMRSTVSDAILLELLRPVANKLTSADTIL